MENKSKKGAIKRKNAGRPPRSAPRLRNRYVRNAKLSEYKFLKVLRSFAEGRNPKDAATDTGISEKTIRATYMALRQKVMEAAKSGRPLFGMGSRYLYVDGELTEKGQIFLDSVRSSDVFQRYLAEQAPRSKEGPERDALVFDLGMRLFTGLHVAEREFLEVSPALQRALDQLMLMRVWIDSQQDKPGFPDEQAETIVRVGQLERMAEIVIEQRQIIALRQSAEHRYASGRYYSDLKGYLGQVPI